MKQDSTIRERILETIFRYNAAIDKLDTIPLRRQQHLRQAWASPHRQPQSTEDS